MPEQRSPTSITAINTSAFMLSFAAWVMLGPSSRLIAQELGVSPSTAALIKATPILVGSLMRLPVGLLADRLGARLTFPLVMLIGAAGAFALSFAGSVTALVAGGLVLGFVGTTFVVGVQSVSSWTPPQKQGFALGIFGSGNVGTAITTFGLPFLLAAYSWRTSFRIYAVAIAVTAVGYFLTSANAPGKAAARTLKRLLAPVKSPEALRFSLYYMASFGAFVATTLMLSDLYIDGYKVSAKTAGLLATTFTFSASLIRMVGGRLADRHGASIVMRGSLVTIAAAMLPIAFLPRLPVTVGLVLVAGLAMGIGSAATFKYIPQAFPRSVGAVSGIVGALGGLGGFFLPMLGASVKTRFGSPAYMFAPLSVLALVALGVQFAAELREGSSVPEFGSLAPSIPPPN